MKKIFVFATMLTATVAGFAQPTPPGKTTTKPAVKPVAKPVVAPLVLKTKMDSVSYVIGEIAAFHLVQQGLGDVKLNTVAFNRALADIMGKKPTLIDDVSANALMTNYMTQLAESKVQPAIEEGKKFLAQNKLKPGVKTTASGLQYEILKDAVGPKPAALDTFVAHYRGTLLNGTEFDASYNRNEPLKYGMSQVIKGWTEGLQLMSIGSKYRFWIPYNLGYGVMGQGQIPGGSLLVFEIELLDIKKNQSQ